MLMEKIVMPFLFLGISFLIFSLFIEKPKTNISAIGIGLIIVYAILTYVK